LGKHSERKAEAPLILPENRCAHVTTWDMLRNPAEAFTLIQAIEQKYGPVESFVFKKVRLGPRNTRFGPINPGIVKYLGL
jgi:hypothetical protein